MFCPVVARHLLQATIWAHEDLQQVCSCSVRVPMTEWNARTQTERRMHQCTCGVSKTPDFSAVWSGLEASKTASSPRLCWPRGQLRAQEHLLSSFWDPPAIHCDPLLPSPSNLLRGGAQPKRSQPHLAVHAFGVRMLIACLRM